MGEIFSFRPLTVDVLIIAPESIVNRMWVC